MTTVLDPMDLLSTPVSDGDLTAALARRPRVRVPSLTMTLLVAAVAGLGFMGGTFVGMHYGASSSSAASAFSRFAAAAASPSASSSSSAGRSGLFGGSGGATLGTVKLVDGNIVYVQTLTGDIVQVITSASTKVTISLPGQVKDLVPGETVIVEGAKNANGSVAATSISQSSLGGGGAFGSGGSGG